MIRPLGFWIILLVTAGGAVLHTNLAARQLDARLGSLKSETLKERARIRVLTAEWSSLTSPERLERLSLTHLDLEAGNPLKIALAGDVPARLMPAVAAAEQNTPAALPETAPMIQANESPAPLRPAAPVMKVAVLTPIAPKPAMPTAVASARTQNDMIGLLIEKDQTHGLLRASYGNGR